MIGLMLKRIFWCVSKVVLGACEQPRLNMRRGYLRMRLFKLIIIRCVSFNFSLVFGFVF